MSAPSSGGVSLWEQSTLQTPQSTLTLPPSQASWVPLSLHPLRATAPRVRLNRSALFLLFLRIKASLKGEVWECPGYSLFCQLYFYVFLLVKVVIQIAFYYTEIDFSPRGNQSMRAGKASSLATKAVLYKAARPRAFVKAVYTLDSIAWSWEGFCPCHAEH